MLSPSALRAGAKAVSVCAAKDLGAPLTIARRLDRGSSCRTLSNLVGHLTVFGQVRPGQGLLEKKAK